MLILIFQYNFRERGYLSFETITLVPIQTRLLEPALLTSEEVRYDFSYERIVNVYEQCFRSNG